MTTDSTPARPCPDPAHGLPASQVGNRRASCRTCNAFARRLDRATAAAMRDQAPELYQTLREQKASELYRKLTQGEIS